MTHVYKFLETTFILLKYKWRFVFPYISRPPSKLNNIFQYSMSKQYLIGSLLCHVTQASLGHAGMYFLVMS